MEPETFKDLTHENFPDIEREPQAHQFVSSAVAVEAWSSTVEPLPSMHETLSVSPVL